LPRAFGIRDEVDAILGAKNAMHQVRGKSMHGFEDINDGLFRR
jgi:hypothetical protein